MCGGREVARPGRNARSQVKHAKGVAWRQSGVYTDRIKTRQGPVCGSFLFATQQAFDSESKVQMLEVSLECARRIASVFVFV